MKEAAVGKSMPSGIGIRRSSSVFTSSAKAPAPVNAMTLSPGLKRVAPSPTDFTTPASSLPGEKGSWGFIWYLFSMISTSGKLTLAAFTVITTSPLPGTGEGMSS